MGLHQLGENPETMPPGNFHILRGFQRRSRHSFPDDPSWPPGRNSVKREGAIRSRDSYSTLPLTAYPSSIVFGVILFMDWLAATSKFPAYMLHTSQCDLTPSVTRLCHLIHFSTTVNTAPPSNLNDSDLSTTEWRTTPLPRNIVTDSSFEYVKYHLAFQ